MESRFNRGKQEQEMNDQDGHQTSFAEAYSNAKDWGKDFRLLINHKPIENLDMDNLEHASLDTQLMSSNIGYQLLQKMRWKGRGLSKDKQGAVIRKREGLSGDLEILVEISNAEEREGNLGRGKCRSLSLVYLLSVATFSLSIGSLGFLPR